VGGANKALGTNIQMVLWIAPGGTGPNTDPNAQPGPSATRYQYKTNPTAQQNFNQQLAALNQEINTHNVHIVGTDFRSTRSRWTTRHPSLEADSERKYSFSLAHRTAVLSEHLDPFSPTVLRSLTGQADPDVMLPMLARQARTMGLYLARQSKGLVWPWTAWRLWGRLSPPTPRIAATPDPQSGSSG
jgi:hypothetical protein